MAEKVGNTMNTNAKTLRKMVINNTFTLGRLTKESLGEDYAILTQLYQNALDSLTEWASKDYAHTSTNADIDNAFATVKAILELFATDENRIIIDKISLRTLRDFSTKPKRMYSAEYKTAEKSRKDQQKQFDSRYDDLLTLGCPTKNEDESVEDYVARVRELGMNTKSGRIDMLSMYENAYATLMVKTKKVEGIKAKGNWTWKRPMSVALTEFADLVENYIADCLVDNYNLKSSKVIRDEKQATK